MMLTVSTPCGQKFYMPDDWYYVPADMPAEQLRAEVKASGSHYFDPDTLRWFGSRNFHMAAPGVSVELQTNAPDGMRYSVTAWHMDDRPEPVGTCHHATLREARACAARIAAGGLHITPDSN